MVFKHILYSQISQYRDAFIFIYIHIIITLNAIEERNCLSLTDVNFQEFIKFRIPVQQFKSLRIDHTPYKKYIIEIMKIQGVLLLSCVLFAVLCLERPAADSQALQQRVEDFLRKQNVVSEDATMNKFKLKDNGSVMVIFDDKQNHGSLKFVLKEDQNGQFTVVFMERFSSSSFSNTKVGPKKEQYHDGKVCGHMKKMRGYGVVKSEKRKNHIKQLLFKELPELKGGDITRIVKHGFKKRQGLRIFIRVTKDGQEYRVEALFKPRKNTLTIKNVQELPVQINQEKSISLGLQLVNKIIDQQIEVQAQIQEKNTKPEQIIPFTEDNDKVMENLKNILDMLHLNPLNTEAETLNQDKDHPLVGSEGEPEMLLKAVEQIEDESNQEEEQISQVNIKDKLSLDDER